MANLDTWDFFFKLVVWTCLQILCMNYCTRGSAQLANFIIDSRCRKVMHNTFCKAYANISASDA